MQTHDYTKRGWGHDYNFHPMPDNRGRMSGWGSGIEAGDYLILPNEGSTTRYQVEKIDYCANPKDMWFADVKFAPRQLEV